MTPKYSNTSKNSASSYRLPKGSSSTIFYLGATSVATMWTLLIHKMAQYQRLAMSLESTIATRQALFPADWSSRTTSRAVHSALGFYLASKSDRRRKTCTRLQNRHISANARRGARIGFGASEIWPEELMGQLIQGYCVLFSYVLARSLTTMQYGCDLLDEFIDYAINFTFPWSSLLFIYLD